MQGLIGKASVLIEALPYIQQFHGAVVVVKTGGSFMEDAAAVRGVLRDLVFMACAGIKPVLLHGGGKAISAQLKKEGVETRFINGLRYTCDKTIRIVDDVLHHQINAGLVKTMREEGGRPCAVSGKSVLRAERIQEKDDHGQDVDLGYVGRVVNVDTESIHWILNRGETPVITPLGRDLAGAIYNINADMAACQVAALLKARKLVFLSDVPGILMDPQAPDSLISTIRRGEVEQLITDGIVAGGMVPKLRSAAAALDAGCRQVHMVDGRLPHSLLLEMFTTQGIGTQIVAE